MERQHQAAECAAWVEIGALAPKHFQHEAPIDETATTPGRSMMNVRISNIALLSSMQPTFGVKAAFLGDSRIDAGFLRGGTYDRIRTHGLPFWIESLSRGRIRCPMEFNFGVNGDTTAQMVARLDAVVLACSRAEVRVVFILGGTNDRGADVLSANDTINNLQAITDAFREVGIIVVVVAELPRGAGNVLSGSRLAFHLDVHSRLQLLAEQPGVYVIDNWPTMCDEADASAQPLSGNYYDGLHPGVLGAYNISVPIAALITQLFPAPPILPASNADLFSANNPRGALNSNPMLTGTGGTGKANAPTGYFCGADADYSVTISEVTSNGKRWKQLAISGTPAASAPSVYLAQTIGSNFSPGDVIEAVAEYEMDSSTTSFPPCLHVFSSGGATPMTGSGGYSDYSTIVGPGPAGAYAGILRTPRITVGAGATSLGLQFAVPGKQSVAQATTVRVRAMKLQKVA